MSSLHCHLYVGFIRSIDGVFVVGFVCVKSQVLLVERRDIIKSCTLELSCPHCMSLNKVVNFKLGSWKVTKQSWTFHSSSCWDAI